MTYDGEAGIIPPEFHNNSTYYTDYVSRLGHPEIRSWQVTVGVEGVVLGREGEIALVTIACMYSSNATYLDEEKTGVHDIRYINSNPLYMSLIKKSPVYILDISTLKDDCFIEGMLDIFASNAILKIGYDLRRDADALLHQFQVKISNVYDLQIADMFYQHQIGKRCQFMSGFDQSASYHLALPPWSRAMRCHRKHHYRLRRLCRAARWRKCGRGCVKRAGFQQPH